MEQSFCAKVFPVFDILTYSIIVLFSFHEVPLKKGKLGCA